MPVEIERKFLVHGTPWQGHPGQQLKQAYLTEHPGNVLRVRIQGSQARLTLKGPTTGATRAEFEYAIPLADAEALFALRVSTVIHKTRYEVRFGSHTWEVDVFHGDHAGLVIAEIELTAEDEAFERPPWIREEVTHDPRYTNASLASSRTPA